MVGGSPQHEEIYQSLSIRKVESPWSRVAEESHDMIEDGIQSASITARFRIYGHLICDPDAQWIMRMQILGIGIGLSTALIQSPHLSQSRKQGLMLSEQRKKLRLHIQENIQNFLLEISAVYTKIVIRNCLVSVRVTLRFLWLEFSV